MIKPTASHPTTKILLAVTGASGQIYAARLAQLINQYTQTDTSPTPTGSDSPTGSAVPALHLEMVFTDTAKIVWQDELNHTTNNQHNTTTNQPAIYPLPTNTIDNNSYYHPYASGSNAADIMIIAPCTMGTIGRIASGATTDLISRAADVMLKERHTLVIVPRENPLNLIHLRNLTTLAQAGAIIAPASPSFYTHPQNLEELIDTFARRILNIAGIPIPQPRFE